MGAICSKSLSKNTQYLLQGSFGKNKWKRKIDVR